MVASIVACIVRSRNWAKLSWPDLMQAGFLGLLEACYNYNPSRSSFRTYADRRINWAVLASIRLDNPKLQVVNRRDYAYEDFELPEQIDPSPRPDRAYELREALDSLTARQREVLHMRLSGYTQDMIAQQLGISQVAVRGLEQRALKHLRQREKPGLDKAA